MFLTAALASLFTDCYLFWDKRAIKYRAGKNINIFNQRITKYKSIYNNPIFIDFNIIKQNNFKHRHDK